MTRLAVKYVGQYADQCGIGDAARKYIAALHDAGVEVSGRKLVFTAPTTFGDPDYDDMLRAIDNKVIDWDVLIIHCIPPLWKEQVDREIESERVRRRNPTWTPRAIIGVSVWETSAIHADWVEAIRTSGVTELWLPSQFNVDAFAACETPSTIVPHTHLVHDIPEPLDLREFGVDVDRFVFGVAGTWIVRKNLTAALYALCAEFSVDEPVALVVKTTGDRTYIEEKIADAAEATGLRDTPPLVVLTTALPPQDLRKLYARWDVGVFPHHGEGWGLHISEAMMCGTPCISTDWSTPTEFVHPDTGYPLASDQGPVTGMWRWYDCKQSWAYPRIGDLQRLMRQAYNDRENGVLQAKGAGARNIIASKYSLAAVGEVMRARLVELLP